MSSTIKWDKLNNSNKQPNSTITQTAALQTKFIFRTESVFRIYLRTKGHMLHPQKVANKTLLPDQDMKHLKHLKKHLTSQ